MIWIYFNENHESSFYPSLSAMSTNFQKEPVNYRSRFRSSHWEDFLECLFFFPGSTFIQIFHFFFIPVRRKHILIIFPEISSGCSLLQKALCGHHLTEPLLHIYDFPPFPNNVRSTEWILSKFIPKTTILLVKHTKIHYMLVISVMMARPETWIVNGIFQKMSGPQIDMVPFNAGGGYILSSRTL